MGGTMTAIRKNRYYIDWDSLSVQVGSGLVRKVAAFSGKDYSEKFVGLSELDVVRVAANIFDANRCPVPPSTTRLHGDL